jgi:hypothetical protein
MNNWGSCPTLAGLGVTALLFAASGQARPPSPPWFTWTTVANNKDLMPTDDPRCGQTPTPRRCFFNSYNQPSVNVNGLVVIRARSRGGGEGGEGGEGGGGENQPIHGIYTRDMGVAGSPVVRILDRKTEVPQPNNAHYPPSNPLLTTFIETPSFPRIDMMSDTIATRGNHQPVWIYGSEGDETRVGTTGIYTNPFGDLITGASKLGGVSGFEFFAVPRTDPPVMFDVFPGAPAVTGVSIIVSKGNYTVGGAGKTGVYYRKLVNTDVNGGPGGGTNSMVLIANNTDTVIPGSDPPVIFGSTSPPSAADGKAVFAGFDNEENPTLGGIYLAPIEEYDPETGQPDLTTLVRIGDQVPGERKGALFNRLGEGVAFDGRYVAFWGAWGAMRTIRLHCPAEGNRDRIAFCLTQCPEPQGCSAKAPVSQGIFLHDTVGKTTQAAAKAPTQYGSFLFWNFSGMVPGVGDGEDDGEPARWRSSAFVAVSGRRTAFKAASGDLVGVYFNPSPGQAATTVVDTRTDGQAVDPEAPAGSTVSEVGLEREGLRGSWLVINAKMAIKGGSEEDGMAGIYITTVPSP